MRWFFFGLLLANLGLFGWNWQQAHQTPQQPLLAPTSTPAMAGNKLVLLKELPAAPAKRPPPAPPAAAAPQTEPQTAMVPQTQAGAPEESTENAAPATPVPTAPPPVQAVCHRLADFQSKTDAAAASAALRKAGAAVRGSGEGVGEIKRYWVMLPKYPSAAAAEPILARLTKAGIKDFYLVRSGSNQNTISLGVYSGQESAERRYREIHRLKLTPNIEELSLPAPRWWVEFDWPADRGELWRKALPSGQQDMGSSDCQ